VLPFPDPSLGDEAVRLRPWTLDDAEPAGRAALDPDVQRFTPIPVGLTEAWIELKEERRRKGIGLELALSPVDSWEWLGGVLLLNVALERARGEIGYWVAPWARGQGLAVRSVELLASWSFSFLGLHRLELVTDAENGASRRVAERCGFALESQREDGLLVYARSAA
jgi:RimJ/RimL family protein N-acetyltransferase